MGHVKLDLTVDERDFVRGVDNVNDALETVIDSMDDVEKESLTSTNKIEAGLKDVVEAAKDTERASRPIGKGFKEASKEANQGLDDLEENSKSNAKEVAASFDGSIESIVDGFQGLAAEAFEGFGVAGIAAGVAVATGIGLATAAFQENEEKAQQAKERIREFGLSIIESGQETASLEFISENLQQIITDADEATKKFTDIEALVNKFPALAGKAGLLARAYAGQTEAIDLSVAALEEQIKLIDQQVARSSGVANANDKKIEQLNSERDALLKIKEATEAAAAVEEEWLASGGAEIEAKRAAIESINAAYDEAAGSVQDFIDEESGVLDVQAYIDAVNARQKALEDYQNALAASGFTTEQKTALEALGVESAAAFLAGYQKASPKQKKELEKILTESAKDSSGVAKGVIEQAFAKPAKQKVELQVDTQSYQRELDKVTKQQVQKIQVQFVDRNGKPVN